MSRPTIPDLEAMRIMEAAAKVPALEKAIKNAQGDTNRLDWLAGQDVLSMDWTNPDGTTCGMVIDPCERLGAGRSLRDAIDMHMTGSPVNAAPRAPSLLRERDRLAAALRELVDCLNAQSWELAQAEIAYLPELAAASAALAALNAGGRGE